MDIGTPGWHDLTVENATELKGFYEAVLGWTGEGLSMGDYEDFVMKTPGGQGVAGVCHRRGENADVPTGWMVYFTVEDLQAALEQATAKGGLVVHGPRSAGGGQIAYVKDPSGAVFAVYQA